MELKDLGEATLPRIENSFQYTYKKANRFPTNKKEFFEAAMSRNKAELDEPLIRAKIDNEDETEEKNNLMIDKVFIYK